MAADKHKKDTNIEADLQLAYSCWRSPDKDKEFGGREMYTFHVMVKASAIILDRIEYVTYKLSPAWPEANQTKTIGKEEGRSTCFDMKELAWGESTINADVKIEGQDKLVALSHPIILTKTGPTLSCAPPVLDDQAPQKILVAGSRKIQSNYKQVSDLAKMIGSKIMAEENWILLNGGASQTSSEGTILSVDHLVCIGAQEKLREDGKEKAEKEKILTLLPEAADLNFHNIGRVETAGPTAKERRINLVKKADVIITIEGTSTGTGDIIKLGMKLEKPVLPIRCTGGKSKKAWDDNEKVISEKFELEKASDDYKIFTTGQWLEDPLSLSNVVIRKTKDRLSKEKILRSLHDTPMHADYPSEDDLLGRKPFAKAIANGIRYYKKEAGHTGSFLVHIYGPWGSGKSTLLKFLRDELDPPSQSSKTVQWFNAATKKYDSSLEPLPWIVVFFDAWQHQRVGPPWWSLMDAVYTEICRKTPLPFSLWIRIKENVWRLWNSWSRTSWIATFFFAIIAVGIFVAISRGIIPPVPVQNDAAYEGTAFLDFLNNNVVKGIMATIASIITGIRAFGNSLFPASPSAANQFQLKTADPMQKLKRHFQEMTRWTQGRPVAIFIDDLDRCKEEYTIEFLEGIQTIFRNAPNLVFIVAADRRWLNSSYQKVYSPFSDTFKDIGRPLGYLFLDKTFQISVAMPKLSGHYREAYFDYLVTLDRDEFRDRKSDAEDQAKNKIKTMSSSQFERSFIESAESPEGKEINNQPLYNLALREVYVTQVFTRPEFKRKTENFLKKFSEFIEPNPRSMKRLVTAFGLWRARDILSGTNTDEDVLAQWVIINQRWPKMATFLEENPDVIDKIIDKDTKEWDMILKDMKVEEQDRNMFLVQDIVKVLLYKDDKKKHLDSFTIRNLASQ